MYSKFELQSILNKRKISQEELINLLEYKKEYKDFFYLIDLREELSHEISHITGTDKNITIFDSDQFLIDFDNEDQIIVYHQKPKYLENVVSHLTHAGLNNITILNCAYEEYKGDKTII